MGMESNVSLEHDHDMFEEMLSVANKLEGNDLASTSARNGRIVSESGL